MQGMAVDDAGNLYVATYDSPSGVVKFSTDPFARSIATVFSTGENLCSSIVYHNSYLYLACAPLGSGLIIRRNAADLTAGGSIVRTGASERTLQNVVAFDPYVYAVSADAPCSIIRIHISNFTLLDTLELSGIDTVEAALITSTGSHIWGAASSAPIELFKLDTAVYTRFDTRQVSLNSGEDGVDSALAEDGTYIYVGSTEVSPALVIKVRMSDYTRVAAVALDTNDDWCTGLYVDRLTGMAYVSVSFSGAPIRIIRIATDGNMARLDSIAGTSNENEAWKILSYANKLYVSARGTIGDDPGNVLQIGMVTTSTTTSTTTTTTISTTSGTPTTSSTSTTTATSASSSAAPSTSSTTATAATTTTATTSSAATTSSTTPFSATSSVPPTTTTTGPSPRPAEYGADDDSLSLSGTSVVAIAAGASAGVGVVVLVTLLCVISRPSSDAKGERGVEKVRDSENGNRDITINVNVSMVRPLQQPQHVGSHVVPALFTPDDVDTGMTEGDDELEDFPVNQHENSDSGEARQIHDAGAM